VHPERFLSLALTPALTLLPPRMDSVEARALVVAICLQESKLRHRRQIKGPARGYAQFEEMGVHGVLVHPSSARYAREACAALDVRAVAPVVHAALEFSDVLTCLFARLLLWTDPRPLPHADEPDRGWDLYYRCWRPGKPHPTTWAAHYARAWECFT
jgi:hypothetical protein